jgi:PAS domain S-box-containing protein
MSPNPDSLIGGSGGGRMTRAMRIQAGLVTIASVALLALAVWAGFGQAVQQRNERAILSARMIERALTRTLESVETMLVSIAEDTAAALRDGDDTLATSRNRIHEALRFAPHIRQIVIARGKTILADSNGSAGQSLDLDSIGLSEGQDGRLSQGLRIGARLETRYLPTLDSPPATVTGRSIVAVGLTVAGGPAGSAPITLCMALNGSYLDAFFADIGLGAGSAHALVRLDGGLLTGAGIDPFDDRGNDQGNDQGQGWTGLLRPVVQAGADEHFYAGESVWWPEASTAVRLSSRYPVAVMLRVLHRDTLREWAGENRGMLLALMAATMAVVAGIGVLMRGAMRRARLQQQVELLFHAIEQSPMAILITEADGTIRYVNPAFTDLLDYRPAEVIGRNPRLLQSQRTSRDTYTSLWDSIGAGKVWRGEFLNKTRNGAIVHVSSTISVMRDAGGATTHLVGVMVDVTEARRIEMERESLLARLDRAHGDLQRFAEVSAHHLQEPVRRLVSFAQLLKAQLADRTDDADSVYFLNVIESQASRMRVLLRDIQLYLAADPPRSEVRTIDTDTVVAAVLKRMADRIDEAGAQVVTHTLPPVLADGRRLTQALEIVVGNAVQHRRPGSPLTIRIGAERAGTRVRIAIADNGPGIPERFHERVFGVFERLNPTQDGESTGIGLAILRRIVENLDGRASVENTPGGGATFVLDLPAGPDETGA